MSYLAELMDNANAFSITNVKATPNILKAEVSSKHTYSKVYGICIDYIHHITNHNSIRRYCCECPNCNLTARCCTHIATIVIIWTVSISNHVGSTSKKIGNGKSSFAYRRKQ